MPSNRMALITSIVFSVSACVPAGGSDRDDESSRILDSTGTADSPELQLVDSDEQTPEATPVAEMTETTDSVSVAGVGDGEVADSVEVPTAEETDAESIAESDGSSNAGDDLEEDTAAVEFMPLTEAGDVVEYVEISRYMGTWYEIATTPSFQQRSCAGTTAEYTFNEDAGWVDVVNSCSVGTTDGRRQQIPGRAELVDTETRAKLQVIFFGQGAPYWVVALDGQAGDAPYEWAVVSVPGGRTMWILSRTPTMTDERRNALEAYLADRGFPIETLLDTPQDP